MGWFVGLIRTADATLPNLPMAALNTCTSCIR